VLAQRLALLEQKLREAGKEKDQESRGA
jgi:hypothetical protein